jgi:hypothetical protein
MDDRQYKRHLEIKSKEGEDEEEGESTPWVMQTGRVYVALVGCTAAVVVSVNAVGL